MGVVRAIRRDGKEIIGVPTDDEAADLRARVRRMERAADRVWWLLCVALAGVVCGSVAQLPELVLASLWAWFALSMGAMIWWRLTNPEVEE